MKCSFATFGNAGRSGWGWIHFKTSMKWWACSKAEKLLRRDSWSIASIIKACKIYIQLKGSPRKALTTTAKPTLLLCQPTQLPTLTIARLLSVETITKISENLEDWSTIKRGNGSSGKSQTNLQTLSANFEYFLERKRTLSSAHLVAFRVRTGVLSPNPEIHPIFRAFLALRLLIILKSIRCALILRVHR